MTAVDRAGIEATLRREAFRAADVSGDLAIARACAARTEHGYTLGDRLPQGALRVLLIEFDRRGRLISALTAVALDNADARERAERWGGVA
jgi:hypothetical protein